MRSTTGSVPGVSSERTANPSIAELGNGGRSTTDAALSARTRPAAASSRTRSDGSGRTRSRIKRCASSIVSKSVLAPLDEPWEAVFVDDGSTDGSFAALTRLHSTQDNVRVVRFRRNFGKAAALAAGFANAQGDVVVTIDADLQDDPAEIPRLLAQLDEGFDLVSGWKAHRRDPITRRALSRIF